MTKNETKTDFKKRNDFKGKKNYRNKKSNFRERDDLKGFKEWEAVNDKPGKNDLSWIVYNDLIGADTNSLPFSLPVGLPLNNFAPNEFMTDTIPSGMPTLPGVMAINDVYALPWTTADTDAINVCAQNLYTFVRHANSGSKNYEKSDLMMYCMAVANIYSFITHCTRLNYTINLYSQTNRYLPDALVRAEGFKPDSFRANLAQFRAWLNNYIAKAASLVVPAEIPYFTRASWLYSNIYKDTEEGSKCQYYVIRPKGFYQWDPIGSENGTALRFKTLGAVETGITYEQLMQYGENLYQAIAYDEDAGIMSGDILKAYGQERVLKLAMNEEFGVLEPVYNEEVLMELQNLLSAPFQFTANGASVDITQDAGVGPDKASRIVFTPSLLLEGKGDTGNDASLYCACNSIKHIMTTRSFPVDWKETAINLQLVGYSDADWTADVHSLEYRLTGFGPDYIQGFSIYYYGEGRVLDYITFDDNFLTPTNYADVAGLTKAVSLLSSFDWHPTIYVVPSVQFNAVSGHVQYFGIQGIIQDFHNVHVLERQELKNAHDSATLALFRVPQMGLAGT